MQVIEKVKVVPEGYNGAGMNYDGGNRRDVNGKANAGLTQQNQRFEDRERLSSLFYLSKF